MLDTQIPGEASGDPSDERVLRRASWETGLDLAQAGKELDDAGEAELADETHTTADTLLNVGLGIARSSAYVDIPLSAMEAFAGKTVDFESGKPVIRDVSNLERAAAVLSLAVSAGGTLVAGPAGAAMGSYIGKVGKEVAKNAGKKVGTEAGETIAREAIRLAENLKQEAEALGEFASNWSSARNLPDRYNAIRHASDHMKHFTEVSTKEQYIRMAQNWLNSPPEGTLIKSLSENPRNRGTADCRVREKGTQGRPADEELEGFRIGSKRRNKIGGGDYYYHEATNTFAIKNELGQPMTIFKPTGGKAYYDKQK